MAQITIEPTPMERGLHEEEYALLTKDLEALGHEVTLRRPIEERSGGAELGIEHAYSVALYLAELVEDHVLEAIIGAVVARLIPRRRSRRARLAVIYGPTGKVLREVEFPSEPADE